MGRFLVEVASNHTCYGRRRCIQRLMDESVSTCKCCTADTSRLIFGFVVLGRAPGIAEKNLDAG